MHAVCKHCVKYLVSTVSFTCHSCTQQSFSHMQIPRGEKSLGDDVSACLCKCTVTLCFNLGKKNKRKESVGQSEISADQCRCSTHINFKVAQNSQYEPVYFHLCTTVLQGVT